MNDIEVLIKRLGYIEESYLNNRYMSIGNFKDIDEAINLLKERQSDKERIKELEKKNELFEFIRTKFDEISVEDIKKIHVEDLEIRRTNNLLILKPSMFFIPTSLIKEKIEERKWWLSSNDISYKDDYVLQVLEELLKGE